ncbi:MAG: hypothetical protein UW44_C0008G0044 [Candidatus Collierbacteria bacterium GW2011_GWB2_44_22]|uniref:Uncharacterized protein n=1 Tax=Candidatus Collierbacteria bacterium GW2011_GWB2_44_22 TaxID=1618387 RepID=A0A0G1K5Y8_9BACT|nr:MAG: hypothetical protein UW44_C0008G0044 [Candidatus Collierbacteria bacterium GW2011_GWB2_44_22]KKT66941.1 MAG: hypothetical protein UW58_C0001G0045 [Candidatus Collierbacteria bacterium GW2011_GWC2_44_30]
MTTYDPASRVYRFPGDAVPGDGLPDTFWPSFLTETLKSDGFQVFPLSFTTVVMMFRMLGAACVGVDAEKKNKRLNTR